MLLAKLPTVISVLEIIISIPHKLSPTFVAFTGNFPFSIIEATT